VASALAVTAAAMGSVGEGRAGLRESGERLAEAWRGAGAEVVVDRTRFLDQDETIAIVLPRLPATGCTTVVFLGPRGLGFQARVPGTEEGDVGRKIQSEAGAVSLERCGGGAPGRVLLSSNSGRGAIETVVARSDGPLPPLRVVLPERTGGALVPGPEPGALPPLPPQESRAEVAEDRARLDGGVTAPRVTWQAGIDGSGAGHVLLDAGCHRVRLFAADRRVARVPGRARLDLDAEMRDEADDRLLARDRSDAPDADLSVCVGETTRVEVVFAGSPPDAPVLVAHVSWSLPEYLPTLWGSEARARMTRALLARHVRSLPRPPVLLTQGGSGASPVPLSIEPGGCYLVVMALVQGTARALGLRVHVGASDVFDNRGVDDGGAVVAFCARERDRALAHVEVRGAPPLAWGLAVYRVADDVWEGPR